MAPTWPGKAPWSLKILLDGDPELTNPYAIIAVDPERFPGVNSLDAQRFIEWLVSPRGQTLIEGFSVNGHQLFHLFETG